MTTAPLILSNNEALYLQHQINQEYASLLGRAEESPGLYSVQEDLQHIKTLVAIFNSLNFGPWSPNKNETLTLTSGELRCLKWVAAHMEWRVLGYFRLGKILQDHLTEIQNCRKKVDEACRLSNDPFLARLNATSSARDVSSDQSGHFHYSFANTPAASRKDWIRSNPIPLMWFYPHKCFSSEKVNLDQLYNELIQAFGVFGLTLDSVETVCGHYEAGILSGEFTVAIAFKRTLNTTETDMLDRLIRNHCPRNHSSATQPTVQPTTSTIAETYMSPFTGKIA